MATWKAEALQLSRGPLGYRSRIADLDGVRLYWFDVEQAFRSREAGEGRRIIAVFFLRGDGPAQVLGREMQPGEVLIELTSCGNLEYVTPRNVASHVIELDPQLLGIADSTPPLQTIAPASGAGSPPARKAGSVRGR